MTETLIEGKTVYTASAQGGDAALQTLLSNITVTPPADWNSNTGPFEYDALLTTFVPSGNQNQQTVAASQSVQPVSDAPAIDISAPSVDEGQDLPITIDVSSPADTPNWTLVDGQVYLQVDEGGLPAGTLKDNDGNALSTESVTGVPDVPDGDYYVLDATAGSTLSLNYEPGSETRAGNIGLSAYARGQESNAGNIETTSTTTETALEPVNNGYDVSVADASGSENAFAQAEDDRSNLVELDVTDGGLVDTDGSETAGTVLLAGVPDGFLVYTGDDAQSAAPANLATNAGDLTGTSGNTWLLGDGQIPDYVAIMPPRYWSGTLENLSLAVTSGENSLTETTTSEALFDLSIDAVANGVMLNPTPSIGTEGDTIALNLNHEFKDPASAGSGDESTETVTLEFTGMGEHAAFYVDGTLISGTDQVTDNGSGSYTVSGLSSAEAENLSFVQAESALSSVQVRAQTEETGGGAPSAWTEWKTIDTSGVTEQYGTTGNDSLLWTGSPIDGRSGEDTIQLRFGEDLTGSELGGKLDNIETIDMTGMGANTIDSLNAQDVLDMTDGDNTLSISGDGDVDSVSLAADGGWDGGTTSGGSTTYAAVIDSQSITLEVQNTLID
jgi:hypothetical protein